DTQAFWPYIKALQLPIKIPISNFSKGMKMQLNLCISISHHPDLLLLDEITSGLDPLMRRKVLRLIKKYVDQNDCAVIITTHNLNDVVEICTRFDLLDHGKIILEKNMQKFGAENLEKLFEETVKKANLGE
ncbi:AAA family ATPase, partial (plasmid) [Lactiplantibacillus plantarum]